MDLPITAQEVATPSVPAGRITMPFVMVVSAGIVLSSALIVGSFMLPSQTQASGSELPPVGYEAAMTGAEFGAR